MVEQYYAKNVEIKRRFYRSTEEFPSSNTVDKATNIEMKTDISDHIDEVLDNTSGVRLTDRSGKLKRRFMVCYGRWLDDDVLNWELKEKEKKELRKVWGQIAMVQSDTRQYPNGGTG